MNNLIPTCFFHMKEIVKNQFNNHLLVEMDEFFIIIHLLYFICNCNKHLLVEMAFVYEFLHVIVPCYDYSKNFLQNWFFMIFASASCFTFSDKSN